MAKPLVRSLPPPLRDQRSHLNRNLKKFYLERVKWHDITLTAKIQILRMDSNTSSFRHKATRCASKVEMSRLTENSHPSSISGRLSGEVCFLFTQTIAVALTECFMVNRKAKKYYMIRQDSFLTITSQSPVIVRALKVARSRWSLSSWHGF